MKDGPKLRIGRRPAIGSEIGLFSDATRPTTSAKSRVAIVTSWQRRVDWHVGKDAVFALEYDHLSNGLVVRSSDL